MPILTIPIMQWVILLALCTAAVLASETALTDIDDFLKEAFVKETWRKGRQSASLPPQAVGRKIRDIRCTDGPECSFDWETGDD